MKGGGRMMTGGLNILLGMCYAALAVCVSLTLFLLVIGDWKLTIVFGSASLFLFVMAVMLNKERRIARMLNDDDYPER